MSANPSIRKIYQGMPERRQMSRMFDRHGQRPNRFEDDAPPLYAGEWFEIAPAEHDYMFEILPPLWMRGEMFALSEFLTERIISVFYKLPINGCVRYFHRYCDLDTTGSPAEMRDTIVGRESRLVRAMTLRGKRTILVYDKRLGTMLMLLEHLTEEQVAGKLPVHLRNLPLAAAA